MSVSTHKAETPKHTLFHKATVKPEEKKPFVAGPKPTVTEDKSPVVGAAYTAATNINHLCGELSSASAEHVINHKVVNDLIAKIHVETANLLGSVAANGGPAVPM